MPTRDVPVRVHRFEVFPRVGDPRAAVVARRARAEGIALDRVRTARVYLIEAALTAEQIDAIRDGLLSDRVTENVHAGVSKPPGGHTVIEVHPLPGVMDPAAQSVRQAVLDLLGPAAPADVQVSTGVRYDLALGPAEAKRLAERVLANPVIHAIHDAPLSPEALPRGGRYEFALTRVPLRDLDDAGLAALSRDAHLFLSVDEMRAIRDEFRRLGRDATDIELETLAQTWSEHCVHKTLKSTITYREGRSPGAHGTPIRWRDRPGHTVAADGSVTIDNLLRSTIAAATHALIEDGVDWTLSVFKDNAGVIALDDNTAVCVKVETHNHPSAIEPYGGAATGIGGCIRDIIGTGLGARPIAATDVFCVAPPDGWHSAGEPAPRAGSRPLPPGCLHPRRVLTDVVAGVRDYGNRMGIPTVAGAVHFDDRFVGNPLVFCGCVGVMPRSRVKGGARAGDRIIAVGGRTGRDGIHGATFSSAELTDTHADEFSHAVQIGNAIEEKRVLDAVMRAATADGGRPLYSGITDCGAGGFSSAVGEMGATLGAEVHLERAPLKYAGLSYTEIWISEAQERMVLAVPPRHVDALRAICAEEGTEMADLGQFGTPTGELVLRYAGAEVGRLDMRFLHDGLPMPTREASWQASPPAAIPASRTVSVGDALLELLGDGDIASKHWIVRQYDHEVQGNTLARPLVGPLGRGPSDAAVIEPVPGSGRGLAISQGLALGAGDPEIGGDPYLMALAGIDECVRNLVCAGADPDRIAILDNFCWPGCADPRRLAELVRAAEGCYDAAIAFRTPFVSGKDSLNNQIAYDDPRTGRREVIEIPPTLLITGIGIVPAIDRVTTSDAKGAGNVLIAVGPAPVSMRGSRAAARGLAAVGASDVAQRVDLELAPLVARGVAALIEAGLVRTAHDCSEGGLLVALAEMLIGGSSREAPIGAAVDLAVAGDALLAALGEGPSRYLLEVEPASLARVQQELADLPWMEIGRLDGSGRLRWPAAGVDLEVERLADAWRQPLDW